MSKATCSGRPSWIIPITIIGAVYFARLGLSVGTMSGKSTEVVPVAPAPVVPVENATEDTTSDTTTDTTP